MVVSASSPLLFVNPLLSAILFIILLSISFVGLNSMEFLSRLFRWDMIPSLMTVGAESVSALLEETSPHKLKTALYGLIMAAISLALCFADLAYKLCRHCKTSTNGGRPRQWEWDFSDGFGLLCSVLILMTAILDYHYLSSGKQQPIRFSMLPLAFSVCVLCSRIFHFQRPTTGGTLQVVCSVCQAQQREPTE